MSYKHIKSDKIRVFPCANRTGDIESKLITEYALTHLVGASGGESCVISTEGPLVVSLEGYYVSIDLSALLDNNGQLPDNIQLALGLVSKAFIIKTDTANEADTSEKTVVIGSCSVSSTNGYLVEGAVDLDQIEGNEDKFSGLIYTTEASEIASAALPTAKSSDGYWYAVLTVRQDGAWTNLKSTTRSVTYSELKSLRDSSSLMTGCQYRITDYNCTTAQNDTQSAGHRFDIVVTADSSSTLNENARAILHADDAYFAKSNLNAWQLKYCLDNDAKRFSWADTEEGKGVIYWMKDEFGNEAPYDFKNIKFRRYPVTINSAVTATLDDFADTPLGIKGLTFHTFGDKEALTLGDDAIYCYTFHNYADVSESEVIGDASLNSYLPTVADGDSAEYLTTSKIYAATKGNIIKPYSTSTTVDGTEYFEQTLNNIVLLAYYDSDTQKITGATGMIFEENCRSMSFMEGATNCRFGADCHSIIAGKAFASNTFGTECFQTIFGSYCFGNTFGNGNYSNVFGDSCQANHFGNRSIGNIFRYRNSNNFALHNFRNNDFYKDASSNSFGIAFTSNTLGEGINYCKFGNSCSNNEIALTGGSGRHITLENGCSYLSIEATGETADGYLRYIHVHEGVSGAKDNKTAISIDRGNDFCSEIRTQKDRFITV